MLSQEELEEFLSLLLRRSRELKPGSEVLLSQLAHEGAQELHAKLMAQTPTPTGGATNQVTKLPTPPQPKEDPDGLFDPQRDISPG